jgi:hypothetical protein
MSIGAAVFANASIPIVNIYYITHEKRKGALNCSLGRKDFTMLQV